MLRPLNMPASNTMPKFTRSRLLSRFIMKSRRGMATSPSQKRHRQSLPSLPLRRACRCRLTMS
ncbi:hypothetical protein Rhsp01_08940 [Rhizobium sp. NBRC 114257]|nr:hypothetical protein Rhsp01_08940 [Rhizobium sp. NBRC 114257]